MMGSFRTSVLQYGIALHLWFHNRYIRSIPVQKSKEINTLQHKFHVQINTKFKLDVRIKRLFNLSPKGSRIHGFKMTNSINHIVKNKIQMGSIFYHNN